MILPCISYIGNLPASDLNFQLKLRFFSASWHWQKKSRTDPIWEDNLNAIENMNEAASISKILPEMLSGQDRIKWMSLG